MQKRRKDKAAQRASPATKRGAQTWAICAINRACNANVGAARNRQLAPPEGGYQRPTTYLSRRC